MGLQKGTCNEWLFCYTVVQSAEYHYPLYLNVSQCLCIFYFNPNLPTPFWGRPVSIWSQLHLWRLIWLCIQASHISLQREMSELCLETKRNKYTQILCKLCLWGWCQKSEFLIVPKGTKFTGPGKLGLSLSSRRKLEAYLNSSLNFPLKNIYFYQVMTPISIVKTLLAFVSICVCNVQCKLEIPIVLHGTWSVGTSTPDLLHWIVNIARSINGIQIKLSSIVVR